MTRITLDIKLETDFRFLNTREKCEFLAYFPEEGTTQKAMLKAGVFNHTKKEALVHRLKKYGEILISSELEDKRFKLLTLNEEGKELQRAARYMIVTNEEVNQELSEKRDYLSLFPEKINPRPMIDTLVRIYSNREMVRANLNNYESPTTVRSIVDRLKSFGLVEIGSVKEGRVHKKTMVQTKAGQRYYLRLLDPVKDFILANHIKDNTYLARNLNGTWEAYCQKQPKIF